MNADTPNQLELRMRALLGQFPNADVNPRAAHMPADESLTSIHA
jgi:hypothetical protein